MAARDKHGRFVSQHKSRLSLTRQQNREKRWTGKEHSYAGDTGDPPKYPPKPDRLRYSSKIKQHEWREGRRVVEWDVLVANLAGCKHCRLGPLYLTPQYLEGEQICGLSGYLYIRCPNLECYKLNRVAYGKTHHPVSEKGNVSFVVNTKLGLG